MNIHTDYKPYRPESFQYESIADDYEPGLPIGYGSTEQEAEENLKYEYAQRGESYTRSYDASHLGEEQASAIHGSRAFPGVEDATDLQSMLDGLSAEHERGN